MFAFWAVRKGVASEELVRDFQRSRDQGLVAANLEKTAREWSIRLALPEEQITSYLRNNIFYYLDDDCLAGLRLFYSYATGVGAIPQAPILEFASGTRPI